MKTVKDRLLRGEIMPVSFQIVLRFLDKHEDSQVNSCFVNDFHLPQLKRGKIPAERCLLGANRPSNQEVVQREPDPGVVFSWRIERKITAERWSL